MKFDHINCRPVYINQRKAPMVPFSNKHEFQTLQSEFVSNYSRLISEVFHRAFDVPQGTSALTWTDRDMILYGMAEFPDLRVRGVDLIMTVTKGHGLAWCISVSSWLADMVTAGCRGHARALRDWPVNTPSSDDIYSRTLVQEMVSSMYDNIEVFDQIYHSSFVDLMHPNTGMISTYTIKNWMQNILAFCMITHNRLSSNPHCHRIDSHVIMLILEWAQFDSNRKYRPPRIF